ncbi:uncharacterized protein BCR38DRAFT_85539 [Pseudomassariella vexata]|uniref:Uncharacterized protein n=1 Tax=Pseudomassariella vexata TaxID=1141098 RepID=A0A1Y2DE52_9PEZI|nr:uncharacterized protein BCR38DRAFT_85539 [Pseudomassariella vexata]ORY57562.1 hypothetical protein BCR38DRAFT_85539 [Pseudomassariella vexata]
MFAKLHLSQAEQPYIVLCYSMALSVSSTHINPAYETRHQWNKPTTGGKESVTCKQCTRYFASQSSKHLTRVLLEKRKDWTSGSYRAST